MGTPDSTSRSARDGVEDVIPDDSLVLLVGTATGSMDGEDADIISSKTLDGEGTTKRSNRQVSLPANHSRECQQPEGCSQNPCWVRVVDEGLNTLLGGYGT